MLLLHYMDYEKKATNELVAIISKISSDKKLLELFLKDILTPQEITAIITRWQIVKRLHAGESQRSISLDLGTGIATVTRGARVLSQKNNAFLAIFKKYSK